MSRGDAELDAIMRARILVVEDEVIVAKDLRNSLRSLGYTVCATCATGADAVDKAEALRPDLVLMDIRLRGPIDGIEAAHRIRARMDVPIVFLTAYSDPDTLSRAAQLGPYGYVLKPFDDRELEVALIMGLCKHRAFADLDRRVQERTDQLILTELRYQRLQSIAELGLSALRNPGMQAVMERAVELVAETLEVELVELLEMQSDGASLQLQAGTGWDEGLVGHLAVSTDRALQAGYTLHASNAVVSPDYHAEKRFSVPTHLAEHGAASGVGVVIHAPGPSGHPFGVLGAHSCRAQSYSASAISFLQAVANVVATTAVRAVADSQILEAERIAEEHRVRASLAEDELRARDEFLSVAAHELRTPLTALHLQMEALRELLKVYGGSLDARIAKEAARTTQTVARLERLVEGVLDVSRIALGKLELDVESLDLAQLVGEIATRTEALADRSGCRLQLNTSGPVVGDWDRVRLEQVVFNLLSNAFKFGAGKPVEVAVGHRGAEAVLTVRDHGRGVDPSDVERILRRFERGVSHRHYGGLGLGLYIAGQIVEAHGGRLQVESPPGDGAEFSVTLPCRRAAA